ncbi:uncharacterized protein L969DRAFT_95336 [Mixia osmundae IAM 14324]|uniref:Uncharacterized protein n=1 Tax=Mixia osmundae (strain CBS 9802 / IAM 14324 / JCM 22182 / KY 12970) TaxID=764103 RepID=G7DZ27_MIXOS|nr:uncharacterized protein L969DRAFT_95336 [Mixia osmundae IAM 14324]KEI38238.1 hypothetical protein L969DRAFT_95336 [Mixia osmundae IAM 14324]GAA95837.1 hypothetical protein E5Q_02494 [Mixia osmundae IAM 14324]
MKTDATLMMRRRARSTRYRRSSMYMAPLLSLYCAAGLSYLICGELVLHAFFKQETMWTALPTDRAAAVPDHRPLLVARG